MNRFALNVVSRLPDSLLSKFVRFYVDRKFKKHAGLEVKGIENLGCGLKRPFIFVCNHLSNSDGLLLNKVLEKENVIFIAGKKLGNNSFTDLGLKIVKTIPISPNSPDKEAIKRVISTVKEGNSILIFPEGTRSRTAKMQEGKKGILLFASLTNAAIVPIGVWGTEKFMPINEDMGKEVFCDAEIHVNIGEAFSLPPKSREVPKGEWEEDCLRHIMMSIAGLLPKEYRGFYDDGAESG